MNDTPDQVKRWESGRKLIDGPNGSMAPNRVATPYSIRDESEPYYSPEKKLKLILQSMLFLLVFAFAAAYATGLTDGIGEEPPVKVGR